MQVQKLVMPKCIIKYRLNNAHPRAHANNKKRVYLAYTSPLCVPQTGRPDTMSVPRWSSSSLYRAHNALAYCRGCCAFA